MTVPKWIDTHVHVSDRGKDGRTHERLLDDLIDVLDRDGADLRWVISPDANWNRIVKEGPDGVGEAAEFIRALADGAPGRLYGSCLVNPHFPDASLAVMDRCFGEWGFVQLGEMLQYMMDYVMDSDEVEALLRKAVEYDVPVQVHVSTSNSKTGPSSFGTEQLDDLLKAVDRVPEAKYILAHAVGGEKDDPPVVDEYLDRVEARYGTWPDNFWMEIRDFNSPGLRSALARVPPTRLLAGTDWTNRVGPPFPSYGTLFAMESDKKNPYPPRVASMIDLLRNEGATDETLAAIGFTNAAELFRLPAG
ncbi:MAG: amidohydrolase [Planctomycetes bacterium]|nr:amidohydrolase [Planctomycetota bacterium]